MNPLKSDEYPAVYSTYIETVVGDVMEVLEEQILSFPAFLDTIPEEKGDYRYAEDKWSIKEVIGHILDNERIMAYRALRFSRNDMKELLGYDQEYFIQNSRYSERTLASLSKEFVHLRKANMFLFENFSEPELERKGMASERLTSVKALLYVIAGHLNHHRIIIQERYFNSNNVHDLVSELQH
ncbi:DNA damage-inducible protein DinB [Sphingobacterium faecium NBRC 15299]|jgi:hypothetical protein|uniref:DinB family protein n=1 Tax=Sphingobacterium faecium TaxID=34087 RepID=UPI000D38A7AA|nr:DinB family protein [Sphingobacterium faecium]MQP29485.1 DinB family protein [Sphingobacterium faecium]PTX12742.1 DinB family protein [Sphingobacterium faecium]GEM62446.1 DNA damage-inducible protein DinB [Sphingobacterium faecium NBRC 15299]